MNAVAPSQLTGSNELTVSQLIEWSLSFDTRVRAEESRIERKRILLKFRETFGPLPVTSLRGVHLVDFINQQSGLKAQWSRRRWCTTIKAAFNSAAKLGLISAQPFLGVSYAKGSRGRDLSDSEFRALLRATTAPFRRVLIFLRFSGARPYELRELEWNQVRIESGSIVIRRHKTLTTQSDPAPRTIFLNPVTVKLINWIYRNQADRGRYVFKNAYGGKWRTRSLCKRLKELREKTRLPGDVKLYGCRHSFATNAILNEVDIATLAKLMGHTSIKTTEWYLHLAGKDDHLRAAARRAVSRGHKPRDNSEPSR